MKKYRVWIPITGLETVEVEAENMDEARYEADKMVDEGKVRTNGYDTEPISYWEVEELE